MSWPSCTVLTPTEFTPIFCISSKSGDLWHHTGAFLQLSLTLSFFSGTESHLSLIRIINIWLEMSSKHFITGVTKRVLMTDSKSVAVIIDQYDISNLTLGIKPSSCNGDNQHVYTQTPENLTGKVTFPIGNLTFPVGYPSCLLNLPYITKQTLPLMNPNASQVTWADRQCSGDLHIWICYPLSHLCHYNGPALKICSVEVSNFSVCSLYCPKTILGFVCLLVCENTTLRNLE